jgi:hypothetical protein
MAVHDLKWTSVDAFARPRGGKCSALLLSRFGRKRCSRLRHGLGAPRPATKKEKMKACSLTELVDFTRTEFFTLHTRIVSELPKLNPDYYAVALETLHCIRLVLTHPTHAPS